MGAVNARSSKVVILGGGPGGYEAALVAAQLGAELLRRQSRHLLYIEEPSAGHNEAAWRAVLPRVLAHLFGDAG